MTSAQDPKLPPANGSNKTKTELLAGRVYPEDFDLVARAAERFGQAPGTFAAEAAVERAHRMLDRGAWAWVQRNHWTLLLALWVLLSLVADLGILDLDHVVHLVVPGAR